MTVFEQLQAIHPNLPPAAGFAALLIGAALINWIAKTLLVRAVRAIAARSSVTWDDALVQHNVFGRLVQVLPALIVFVGVPFVPDLSDTLVQLTRNLTMGYTVLMLTLALTAMLSAASSIYGRSTLSKERPLKGFFQLMQIVVWMFGGVMIIAAVLDRSPLLLLSGFGAMTAVLLLVFKDTLLSLVASVQLTAQDMVRVGDWIEVPQFDADGDVVDIQLHTIKVQNWDKTITTIPTHRLISDSFKNWRGMQHTGARRIKRALYLDVSTIRMLSDDEVEQFKRFALLKGYIADMAQQLADYNSALGEDVDPEANSQRLTNIGTLRAYALRYLQNHPQLRQDMTLMVRQLAPGPEGLPLEIYCFTATTVWTEYEGIQADIFDHLLAVVQAFGLRLYQKPAGSDLARLVTRAADASTAGD